MKIGLVAECKWEVREVVRQLKMKLVNSEDRILGAGMNDHEIRLCLSGMIPSLARERVERFLDRNQLELMICTGLAGALRPHINVGDLVVQSEDSDLVAMTERALKETTIPFHVGPLVTVAKPVLTPAARQALAAKSQAIAVDMESQTVADLCRQRGLPCLVMKGVSDGIGDDLSPILGGFEVVHVPRIALRVLSRPDTWPLAARLARHSYAAARNVGYGVMAMLERLQGGTLRRRRSVGQENAALEVSDQQREMPSPGAKRGNGTLINRRGDLAEPSLSGGPCGRW